jgi:uncharacterized protein (TIGR02466 family)
MSIELEHWFPTTIGYVFNPNHNEIQDELVAHCKTLKQSVSSGGQDWLSKNTYNTSDGKHDCFEDEKFGMLNQWVIQQVNEYADMLKIKKPLLPHCSWFNIYDQNDYQEFHVHPGLTISAIYMLAGDEDSAKVYFKSPKNEMFHIEYEELSSNTFGTINYNVDAGKLLLFTSDTSHSVERHNNSKDRITVSYNFIQERS